ncbi:MAG TPA: hypothetical protein VEI26_15540 [Terriglobales bacterium]|nr:hypothetical protein [Terriglobales bacterium]
MQLAKCRLWFLVSCLSCSLYAQPSATTETLKVVPPLVSFSGVISDVNGKPLTGVVGVTFALYAEQQGGTPLWLETQNVYPDKTGHYTVMLGSTSSSGIPSRIFASGEARWLGVQPQGQAEQPRVFVLSVPYAMEAANAQTVGGLPASAFVLAAPPSSSGVSAATQSEAAQPSVTGTTAVTTADGSVNAVPLWDSVSDITSSVMTQTGSGSTARIGIGTSKPGTTLDVNGTASVRGTLYLNSAGTATAGKGYNSRPQDFIASAYNSSTSAAVPQTFQWQAEPSGNDTGSPSGTLNLLFGSGSNAPGETGLKIGSNGRLTFAGGQSFPGTVTSVALSAPISDFTVSGSPVAGSGTLGLNWTVAPTNSSTANAIVKRNSTGGFSSGPIYATANSGAYPIAGYDFSSGSHGVDGYSGNGYGVYGTGVTGVYGSGSEDGDGVDAINDSGGYGLYSWTADGTGISAYFNGPTGHCAVFGDGGFVCTGSKSAVVPVNGGARQVALYAVEAPENWFEDFGSARLSHGEVVIRLEPTFAQTVNTEMNYHVFLTPRGECEGLYVAESDGAGFTVHELHHGTSNVAFDYRIVARRKGYENIRLADMTKRMGRPRPRIPAAAKQVKPAALK